MNDEKELWDALVLKLAGLPIGDQERPETTATRIIERRRMFFDEGVGVTESDITDPQKPTKPAIPLCACKRPPPRHIQTVKGDGWLDCDGVVRFYS